MSVGTYSAWGNYCYVVVCLAALGASAPTKGGEGRGHIVAAARLQLVEDKIYAYHTCAVNFLVHHFTILNEVYEQNSVGCGSTKNNSENKQEG